MLTDEKGCERKKREKEEWKRGRRGVNRIGKGREEGKDWRILFWNVAGLANKDRKFWEDLGAWDVIVLSEYGVRKRVGEK